LRATLEQMADYAASQRDKDGIEIHPAVERTFSHFATPFPARKQLRPELKKILGARGGRKTAAIRRREARKHPPATFGQRTLFGER